MTSHLPPTDEMTNVFNLRRALQQFASSVQTFQVLRTLPSSDAKLTGFPRTLYILDSSFNPPTLAHLRICASALLHDRPSVRPKRLLLLLATQNADKAPKPAAFEQRLAMMRIFANELLDHVGRSTDNGVDGLKDGDIAVDVGVTKEARFVDKTIALEKHWNYTYMESKDNRKPVEQVHLTGFDTLIRLLDVKYYPPDHNLKPLEGLFGRHRVRVTRRPDDAWGGTEAQDEYLDKLRAGDREYEGGNKDWADRIELVDGRSEGDEVVSSTRVREAAKAQDEKLLKKLVTDGVATWILNEKLYLD